MARFVVVGGTGMMGSVVVKDLFETTKDQIIIVAREGAQEAARKYKSERVTGVNADVKNLGIAASLFLNADVVINCAIYYLNLEVMNACLRVGTNYVDLGGLFHMTKKQLALNKKFKNANLTAILGMGSTPGITNVLAAYGSKEFDSIDSIDVKVGWADFSKRIGPPPPVPYAIATLVDEFTKKPAVFKNGKMIFVEPVTGKEVVLFPKPIGKKTAIYTLHSELATFPKSFKLKNASFRVSFDDEFIKNILYFVSTGMTKREPIEYNGTTISALDVLSKFISLQKVGKVIKRNDYECLRVEIQGKRKKKKARLQVDCIAKSHQKYDINAGDLDTGTPPSIVAQMIATGTIAKKGVFAPEFVVPEKEFFKELFKRGMRITKRWI